MVSVCSDGDRARLTGMASPIEATPTLRGEDARRLIESLENRCSNEEAERRMAWAKKVMAEMTRPKNQKEQDHELAKAVRVELDKLDEARERAANAAFLKSESARFEAVSYRCKDLQPEESKVFRYAARVMHVASVHVADGRRAPTKVVLPCDEQTSDLAGDARVMAKNLVCSLKRGEFIKKAAIASAATLLDHIADTLDPAGRGPS